MIDLLPLVLEEQAADNTTLGVAPKACEPPTTSGHVPEADAGVFHDQERNDKSGKSFLAKYKTLVTGKKKRTSSGGNESLQEARRSNSEQQEIDFAPLGRGEGYSEGSPHELSGHLQNPALEPDPAAKEPTTFMEKVKAYRTKRKDRVSKSEVLDSRGPLAQGMVKDSELEQQVAGLEDFFAGVTEAKELLGEICTRQQQVISERAHCRTIAKSTELAAAQEQIQDSIDQVTLLCRQVKAKLDRLDSLNAQLLDDEEEEYEEQAGLKLRLSVMAGLNAKLADVIQSWQELRTQWQEEDRLEAARQLHTVTGLDFSPDQVEELVHNGGTESLYRQALANAHSSANVQQLMTDVQQRHDQIRQVEVSMLELHQAMLDMSILVADQGDTINSIDNWVGLS